MCTSQKSPQVEKCVIAGYKLVILGRGPRQNLRDVISAAPDIISYVDKAVY